jgi:hypothetical protein
MRRNWQQAVATLMLAAFGLYALRCDYYGATIKTDWRGAARVVAKYVREDALVLTATEKEARLLRYYAERTSDRIASPRIRDANSTSSSEMLGELRHVNDVLYVAHREASTNGPALTSLTKHARLVGRAEPFRVIVEHYRVAP